LDVIVVLDYSKSMYARDVAPSRIARAKAEIGKLVRDLPGARLGAVAFAGEPMSFPMTSDAAAIAQFFRQLEPNDMPLGGTEIARGLKRMMGEELAERVETAFDEEYMWPLGFAVLLLAIEGVVPEAPLPRLAFGFVGGGGASTPAPDRDRKKKGAPAKKRKAK